MINGSTKLVGVIGFPVAHTRSPHMHNHAFQKMFINMIYLPLLVKKGDLAAAVAGIKALNFAGANVTIPFKEAIIPYLDDISKESRLIGAVNTIINRQGRLSGTTTDPYGIIMALKSKNVRVAKKRATILGTGGTARTALFTLGLNRCRNIAIAGRHPEKAERMIQEARKHFGIRVPLYHLKGKPFEKRVQETDLLLNCTSVGMSPHRHQTVIKKKLLHKNMVVFDSVYNPVRTRLLREAGSVGAKTISGIHMLVYQGMEAFKLWTRKTPAFQTFYKKAIAHD